jgi:hypothetical protein
MRQQLHTKRQPRSEQSRVPYHSAEEIGRLVTPDRGEQLTLLFRALRRPEGGEARLRRGTGARLGWL